MEQANGPGLSNTTGDASKPQELLRVVDLRTEIALRMGVLKAVDGVSFAIKEGESVGLVGESGSGKTMTCLSIIRLLPVRSAQITGGEIWFEGRNLLRERESGMRRIRGRRIAIVMQDPLSALNPVLNVGEQVEEPLRFHTRLAKASRRERVLEVLSAVRIPRPAERLRSYPHQFSGGMRQRIVAAMGLGPSPSLLIADEPTTALDVTVQAQVLTVIRDIQRQRKLSVLWVTHDLGVVAQICDRVNVMYAGRLVESGDVRRIFSNPLHPYTVGLMESVPRIGARRNRLYQIPGQPPNLLNLPPGCPFYDRCPLRMDICRAEYPPPMPVGDGFVHCWAKMPTDHPALVQLETKSGPTPATQDDARFAAQPAPVLPT